MLAEYKEAMDSSDIQFRVSLSEEPIYARVDRQKLWRAFDNLIGNMLKYEISENAKDLFERFKRGDTTRHTEGSGLGLVIAKSNIDLHESRLMLETDDELVRKQ